MIHKTSIIDPKANISSKANIGPFCIIGPNVIIEDEVVIHAQVNINGNTKIGSGSIIYPFASIGNDPQDLKYNGEKNSLIIGSNNKIREYVSINPGTVGGGGQTKIGDNCLFMVSSHVAHDCLIGNNVVFANNVAVGGHVRIDDDVVVGGNSAIQQFTRIGKMAMIGGMCGVVKDVIPYGMAFGNRCSLHGLNLIGLRRKNIPNKEILSLSRAYKEIFKTENLSKNLLNLNKKFNENYLIKEVIHFINKDKKRPICTPYSK